jgi:hypothetical protein
LDPIFYPAISCLAQATATAALLAGAKLRLFKDGFQPGFGTVKADLVAVEADYSGYTPGGVVIASFGTPVRILELGYAIIGQPITFARGAGPTSNVIGGWWLETAAGDLYAIGTLPAPQPMQVVGQGVPILVSFGAGTG